MLDTTCVIHIKQSMCLYSFPEYMCTCTILLRFKLTEIENKLLYYIHTLYYVQRERESFLFSVLFVSVERLLLLLFPKRVHEFSYLRMVFWMMESLVIATYIDLRGRERERGIKIILCGFTDQGFGIPPNLLCLSLRYWVLLFR